MLKNYDPYATGRWYRFFVESDGDTITLVESDLEGATLNGSRIKTIKDFHIKDVKYDITAVAGGSAAGVQWSTYIYADGFQAFNLPAKDLFTSAYIYVFGCIEE